MTREFCERKFDFFGDLNRTEYVFDWNNRLRNVTKSSQTTSYDYGEDGIRLIKTTPSETTIFIDKYTELRGSSVVRHIYANEKLIASIDELNNTTYNHSDHLGSSNLKTDSVGAVVKRIEYAPFGDKRAEIGSYNQIKNRFTGQYEDEESDLYYYQQRYYDPILSRFISADPLYSEEMDKRGVNSQELNLYSYVKNNPLKYTDPTGEFGIAGGIYGAFAGAVGGYVGSGGSFNGTLAGAIAGGIVGLALPSGSGQAGMAAAGAISGATSSALGQFVGHQMKPGSEDFKMNYGAVIGAAFGGAYLPGAVGTIFGEGASLMGKIGAGIMDGVMGAGIELLGSEAGKFLNPADKDYHPDSGDAGAAGAGGAGGDLTSPNGGGSEPIFMKPIDVYGDK